MERHRAILEQERALRRELDEIENLRHQTLRADADAHARQILGADGLWQGWLAQRRMALNQELAMVQVRKFDSHANAKTAFARHQVTADLAQEAARERYRLRSVNADRRLEEDFRPEPE